MLKKYINIIKQKKGMSLVEVMTAMTILTMMIFCFAPLFLSYFNSIDIAGEKLDEVYHESGIMQRIIGNINKSQTQDSDGYITPFQNIPLTLTSNNSVSLIKTDEQKDESGKLLSVGVISDDGKSIAIGATIKTKAADTNGELTDISGGLLLSNPNNMDDSIMSFYASSIDAGFYCYPNSITDDFIKKDIIVIAKGMAASCSGFEVYVNVDQTTVNKNTDLYESYDAKYGGKLKGDKDGNNIITSGVSWSIEPLAGVSDAFVLTVYGGRGISFENSPLIIKYGVEYKAVEVDAPSMIMVGEANKNGEYNYYVSRGEIVDPDGDGKADTLAVLQRTMKGDAPLTSAMNDVEWVEEESADSYTDGKKIDGTKYGYYVMCGDEGQVRRFWRNADVLKTDSNGNQIVEYGNYYWGGDYTYYTDYNLNRFTGSNTYINTTNADGNASPNKVLSTDVSFKYIAMRPMYWSEGRTADGKSNANEAKHKFRTGFNMSSKKYKDNITSAINVGTAHLRNLCTVSATYGDQVQFYASDGQIYTYIPTHKMGGFLGAEIKVNGNDSVMPSWNQIQDFQDKDGNYRDHPVTSVSSQDYSSFSHEAWGWMDPGDGTSSYYKINGLVNSNGTPTVDTKSYPITLTSVDAIRINGTGGVYESNMNNSHYSATGIIKDTDTSGDASPGTGTGKVKDNDGDGYGDIDTSKVKSFSSNLSHPNSNYVLYCGYIPAYMDAWASVTGSNGYAYTHAFDGQYAKKWDANALVTVPTQVGRASNRTTLGDNAEYNTIWRMTMGIAPIYKNNTELLWNKTTSGTQVYSVEDGALAQKWYHKVVYYPYTNLEYAITGKYYDQTTYNNNKNAINALFPGVAKGYNVGSPALLTSPVNHNQDYATNGKVVDITIAYLSDPLAISISANPTDDKVYDLANNKSDRSAYYWHNRRESITFLDSASTVVPNGDKDVPVSLMVGYVLGGTVAYGDKYKKTTVDITSVMNNGIVFLRSGSYNAVKHDAANAETGEFKATDYDGYTLSKESNVFHQFYYLNSRSTWSDGKEPYGGLGWISSVVSAAEAHIGDMYGADYWQNNRHILNRSLLGGIPTDGSNNGDNKYEYLRAHPMSDTKVNCVAWGVTWNGNPEAMWGTDNGTVLSWWVDLNSASGTKEDPNWNDRSVDAEIQSYKWIVNCSGKNYPVVSAKFANTVGSQGESFHVNTPSTNFKTFFDKGSQSNSEIPYSQVGFINTLENINDIEFSDDIWVAVGDQGGTGLNENSFVDPADYCANGSVNQKNIDLKSNEHWKIVKAYSGTGEGGSWVNVRYWVDLGNGKQSNENSTYHWRAVQITNQRNCNIVQINNVNGMWIATGYQDTNGNDEYDTGEKPVVCWAYDPLVPYGEDSSLGGWSDKVEFYEEGATSATSGKIDKSLIGGINSCATRS